MSLEVGTPTTTLPPHRVGAMEGCARAWFISKLFAQHKKVIVVCKSREEAETLVEDIEFFIDTKASLLPSWDTLPFEPVSPQVDVTAQRIASLFQISKAERSLTILPADALMQRVLPKEMLETLSFTISPGLQISISDLSKKAKRAGFDEVSLVEEVGDVATRGVVVDIFPAHTEYPIRIEWDGQIISSIKSFDPDSQRSIEEIPSATILPVRELISFEPSSPFNHLLKAGLGRLQTRTKLLEVPPRESEAAINAIAQGLEIPGLEILLPILLEKLEPLSSWIPEDAHWVIVDDLAVRRSLSEFAGLIEEREKRLLEERYLIPSIDSLYRTPKDVWSELSSISPTKIDALTVSKHSVAAKGHKKRRHTLSFSLVELRTKLKTKIGTGEAFAPVADAINAWRKDGYRVAFVVGSHTRAERLQRILLDFDIEGITFDSNAIPWLRSPDRAPVAIIQGHLSEGGILTEEDLVFVAESDVFGERSYRKAKTSKTNLKKILSSLAQLSEGDYVVHTDFGVGIYRGLTHREIEDSESDFLHIEYADSKLYLPVQNIGKIQKFVAAEGQKPALDKLGSNRWVKTKEKVKKAVIPLAADLIKLYAARSVVKGWRYEPFGAEDERFADEFAYNETQDQLKAIEETIADMASEKPMDRLVCGDVGFGKTEVALRAAFKCLQHGRQVGMLVPTTLLVEQHHSTFVRRFQGYSYKFGALSRFHSAEENKKTLDMLAAGEIDLVVGTHKLLQRDVIFKDLGLLIVDEEHRFGVKQKEQLKALKKQVDVLTLTATPIPRTLHMSLLGIRDISIISTPPTDRRVIRTYVAPYDNTLVRDAIMRELQRGGQSFFVHNKVQTIASVCARLRELVPEAKFEFAHGQMKESELEEIMRRFLNREIDVLVTTTIIESGIDIPNANTILIDRADQYGLAQLYQIRGRVGRSDKQAYSYFFIPKSNKLTDEAQKRLKAIQSLDDLGLGFNLAIRDLEIRGAGNLLGKEQSGNVLAVGFELYSKILQEAVYHLKGEDIEIEETIDPEVKIGIHAFIPEKYVPDISERLVLYQRLANVRDDTEMVMLTEEIEDRFGPMPPEVFDLSELMRFRSLLRSYGAIRAELKGLTLTVVFTPRAKVDGTKIVDLVREEPKRYRFSKNFALTVTFEKLSSPAEVYGEVRKVLKRVGSRRE